MILLDGFENKLIGVLGIGKTGLAAAASLLQSGAKVLAIDDRENQKEKVIGRFN